MSSDEDEWEREQMLRGCQKLSKQGASRVAETQVIDVNFAKEHLFKENERLTTKIEQMKRSVGGLKREIAERENRKNSLRKLIEQLMAKK